MTIDLQFRNLIGGQWRDSKRKAAVRNPADLREVLHEYPMASDSDVVEAVAAAKRAFESWRRHSLHAKAAIFRRAAVLVRENRQAIARTITRENGKLIAESLAEIDSAALEIEYQTGEGERQLGSAGDCQKPGLFAFTRKEPLGVVTAIIPWNFPFNVPFRKLVPALMAGNVAILKPASQTPAVGELVVQILLEAGLPPEVLQFITGSGRELSESLVAQPEIRAVTFTGSTAVGREIAQLAATNFTRTQLEMGGKNPMVVLGDADLDLAVSDAVTAAFSCAGQWCTATSRLIVTEDVADTLVERIVGKVNQIVLGRGDAEGTTMGPVCGEGQLRDVLSHVEAARDAREGVFLTGGERSALQGLENGCFVEPTLLDEVAAETRIARTEVFGPVLAIMRVATYEAALGLANDVPYGLSSSIYTRDLDKALHFAEHSEVGLTHINVHSAYKEPQHCFGGVKQSGFGLPEAGTTGIQFFQDDKAVYLRKRGT
ncbi:aldehyde dehydrogenase family protein [Consotaella aegiceratis]|uniref:aldehyde dehydrogenase family protein n=1 Tax=Consotaella aegiceratis TaxID=3097961 RepID=UPI002F41E98B